jgi:hypothetical protein
MAKSKRTTRSGRNLGKEGNRGGEENRGRESPGIPAPAERITITGAQREAEREKERREGDFLLWRLGEAGRQERVV